MKTIKTTNESLLLLRKEHRLETKDIGKNGIANTMITASTYIFDNELPCRYASSNSNGYAINSKICYWK